jgi:poly(3-hydroxybutyrate) depolymerase
MPAQEPPLAPETSVAAGVRALPLSPERLPTTPGLSEAHWYEGTQRARSARVWMPEAAPPRTLVILLHGATRAGSRRSPGSLPAVTQRLITCLAAPALAGLDPIIIAPHSVDGRWWTRTDTEFVLGLARAARERWPDLGHRSVIMGYSNGGIGTWYFARLYPEYFSAAVPMAANDTIVGATPLPVYAIQGAKDELFPIEPVRAAIASARTAGVDVTLCERYRAGHMNACAYEPELARAAGWLEQHAFPKALGAPDTARTASGAPPVTNTGSSDCR